MREWAYNQGAAQVIEVDDDERLSLTPVAAAVLADPDHPAYAMGPFSHLPGDMGMLDRLPGGVPHRDRARLRRPRSRVRGGHRPRLRAVDADLPAPRRRPAARWRGGAAAGRHHDGRRGLRRRRHGAAVRRRLPRVAGGGLRHLAARPRPRAPSARPRPAPPTSSFLDPRDDAAADRRLASGSSRRSTASTT